MRANDLALWADFRDAPDGGLPAYTDLTGRYPVAPIYDISDYAPAYFSPTVVENGAVRAPVDGDPARSGLAIVLANGMMRGQGRVSYCHAGYENVSALGEGEEVTGNLAIADELGNGYILHTAITADGPEMRIIRDDLSVAYEIASEPLDDVPEAGDVLALGWLRRPTTTKLIGYLNDARVLAVSDSTHDPRSFVGVGMPIWQDHPEYRFGAQWIAMTTRNRDYDPTIHARRVARLREGL